MYLEKEKKLLVMNFEIRSIQQQKGKNYEEKLMKRKEWKIISQSVWKFSIWCMVQKWSVEEKRNRSVQNNVLCSIKSIRKHVIHRNNSSYRRKKKKRRVPHNQPPKTIPVNPSNSLNTLFRSPAQPVSIHCSIMNHYNMQYIKFCNYIPCWEETRCLL